MNPTILQTLKEWCICVLGESWKTSLTGLLQAVALAALSYLIGCITDSQAVTYTGIAAAALQAIRGFLQKDFNISNKGP